MKVKVAVVGTCYVGLVSGDYLNVDQTKIKTLNEGGNKPAIRISFMNRLSGRFKADRRMRKLTRSKPSHCGLLSRAARQHHLDLRRIRWPRDQQGGQAHIQHPAADLPIIFRQKHDGLNGKDMTVYNKFRWIHLIENGAEVTHTTLGNARIHPFGAFIRYPSLNELSQFIKVLQGSMSIVSLHAGAYNEGYRERVKATLLHSEVNPSITSWAQVNCLRGETSKSWLSRCATTSRTCATIVANDESVLHLKDNQANGS